VKIFQETILILEPSDSKRLHKRRKQAEKNQNKQPNWKFDFQRAKRIKKNRKETEDLEVQKIAPSTTDGKSYRYSKKR
jgi:hypothetical protein